MKRVLHISDLHFGRIHPPAIESLQQFLRAQGKYLDLIIVTGDWTQRARRKQFQAAAKFIDQLSTPILTVPGNHDIPLYDIFSRLFNPFTRYNQWIKSRSLDIYQSDELVVVGLNTAHPSRSVEGKISSVELQRAEQIFRASPSQALRVIACHHPLFAPNSPVKIKPAARVQTLMDLKPHLILSGHFHRNWAELVDLGGIQKALHLSAGSATSDRLRGEANSFHVIEIEKMKINVMTYHLDDDGFISAGESRKEFQLNDIASSAGTI